ncbi:unnamed protein product [Symbiodinium natans]|uniref:Uncharacterized protein n=1 Tax=Symbiodinium natans TaxID=878477 RepID=A0A812I4K3_9DINO|nr:unnamed protein product [Symbiodinium natans]
MAAALLPPEVERAFQQNPGLRESLDEGRMQLIRDDRSLLCTWNWQDVWRTDVTKCTQDNLAMFTDAKGKKRTRRLDEMTKIVTDRIMAKMEREEKEKKAKEAARVGHAGAAGRKLSKKERMKQDLSGHLGQIFNDLKDSSTADAKKNEEMYQAVFQQGEQMVNRMAQQAKLPLDTEVTLREWCDMAWRAGRFSPLDPDFMLVPKSLGQW